MESENTRYSTLIVSGYRKFTQSLKQILIENEFEDPCIAESINDAKRLADSRPFDIILIRLSAPDDASLAHITQQLAKKSTCTAVFTSLDSYDSLFEMLSPSGIYLIPLTPSKQMLLYSLDWLKAGCERVKQNDRKNLSFDEKIRQLRMVNRAIWLLIERDDITEEQAQKKLEAMAKEENITRAEAAEKIISQK